jgi:hypothetical protein
MPVAPLAVFSQALDRVAQVVAAAATPPQQE